MDGPASRRTFVLGIVSLGASRWPPQIVIRYAARVIAMTDAPPTLSYAGTNCVPTRNSHYGNAAVWLASASLIWFVLPFPFDAYKHHGVGTWAALVSILLAGAGLQRPQCRRTQAWIGFGLGIFSFLAYILLVPA